MYEKLTELDQRSKANAIRLDFVSSQLEKCLWDLSSLKASQRETSNGLFVWEISNVDHIKTQLQTDQKFNIYSSPFSSSERGYRWENILGVGTKAAMSFEYYFCEHFYTIVQCWISSRSRKGKFSPSECEQNWKNSIFKPLFGRTSKKTKIFFQMMNPILLEGFVI